MANLTETLVLENLASRCGEACVVRKWDRGWSAAGCYLMLESAEFIEALRGKGSTEVAEEAADVLFVLLSTLEHHGYPVDLVLDALDAKIAKVMQGVSGRGGGE